MRTNHEKNLARDNRSAVTLIFTKTREIKPLFKSFPIHEIGKTKHNQVRGIRILELKRTEAF